MTFYIGELCRYLLAQPDRPTDTQHGVRICIGNGLRPQIWTAFTKRFGIANILEFYGSTESNGGLVNPFNKPGACGFGLKVFTMLNQQLLIKVELFSYLRNLLFIGLWSISSLVPSPFSACFLTKRRCSLRTRLES